MVEVVFVIYINVNAGEMRCDVPVGEMLLENMMLKLEVKVVLLLLLQLQGENSERHCALRQAERRLRRTTKHFVKTTTRG